MLRRIELQPDASRTFSMKKRRNGSLESLRYCCRSASMPYIANQRCTVLSETPLCLAVDRTLHCARSRGLVCSRGIDHFRHPSVFIRPGRPGRNFIVHTRHAVFTVAVAPLANGGVPQVRACGDGAVRDASA